ncbi:FosX/FosE/FosI family fosfomycin resistance hydrolase [Pseudooceanicola atlanticus]|uniref:Fosmidomycin resistance protein n=1 Tax=Pseudooceanicola atlanticus TaxID=1461694 RepID=A0A0A0EIH7_9RHOB|nr:FosX/FosE/FosI family fosfomycin resistance hydrolase [Pseudooceanicola atlanticus]KGM48972.1 fosmidomycin resistance protein [Pseudooceanicola atlanticus]
MSAGLSHITLIVSDLDATQRMLEQVFKARCIYDSGAEQFSISEERFFDIGGVWVATMKGEPLPERSYNHVAFRIDEAEFDDRRARIEALGLDLLPPRPRVEGEGRSLYFYGPDNHLFELHTGTLAERLARYAKGREGAT